MFGSLSPVELGLILLIIIVLFGVGRISKLGGELGSGIRSFRDGLKGDDGDEADKEAGKESNKKEG